MVAERVRCHCRMPGRKCTRSSPCQITLLSRWELLLAFSGVAGNLPDRHSRAGGNRFWRSVGLPATFQIVIPAQAGVASGFKWVPRRPSRPSFPRRRESLLAYSGFPGDLPDRHSRAGGNRCWRSVGFPATFQIVIPAQAGIAAGVQWVPRRPSRSSFPDEHG